MSKSRYYTTDVDTSHHLWQWMPDWYAVVDEKTGGVIAYFANESQAKLFSSNLSYSDPGPA